MNINVFCQNNTLPPIQVHHQDLERYNDSDFKSKCLHCPDGFLAVQRDIISFKLQPHDTCLFCGRRYIYTDIEESTILTYKK